EIFRQRYGSLGPPRYTSTAIQVARPKTQIAQKPQSERYGNNRFLSRHHQLVANRRLPVEGPRCTPTSRSSTADQSAQRQSVRREGSGRPAKTPPDAAPLCYGVQLVPTLLRFSPCDQGHAGYRFAGWHQ